MTLPEQDTNLREAAAKRADFAANVQPTFGFISGVAVIGALIVLNINTVDVASWIPSLPGILLLIGGLVRSEQNANRAKDLRAGEVVLGTGDYFRGRGSRAIYYATKNVWQHITRK